VKAVIVDIKEKYAVALKENGEFVRIRNKGEYKVGYEYDIEKPFLTRKFARIASIAAAFVLIVGVGAGVYSYNMPYTYVDLEINPSVEITSNIFDRIINVRGLNDDGQQLVLQGGIKNRVLKEGIDIILSNAVEQGYLKRDQENAIVITVSVKDSSKAEQLEKSIEAAAAEKLQSYSVNSEILIEETTVDNRHEAVIEYGITSGKMNLINKLIEKDPSLKIEDLKDKPVKDIMKSIKELKRSEEDNDKNDEDKINILNKPNKDNNESNKDNDQNNSNVKSRDIGNNKGKNNNRNNNSNKDSDDNSPSRISNKSNKNNDKSRDNIINIKVSKDDADNRNNMKNNKCNRDDDKSLDNKINNKGNKNADDNRDNKVNSKSNNDAGSIRGNKVKNKSNNDTGNISNNRINNKGNNNAGGSRDNKINAKDNKNADNNRYNKNYNKQNKGK